MRHVPEKVPHRTHGSSGGRPREEQGQAARGGPQIRTEPPQEERDTGVGGRDGGDRRAPLRPGWQTPGWVTGCSGCQNPGSGGAGLRPQRALLSRPFWRLKSKFKGLPPGLCPWPGGGRLPLSEPAHAFPLCVSVSPSALHGGQAEGLRVRPRDLTGTESPLQRPHLPRQSPSGH